MELEQLRRGLCLCWWQETGSSSEQVSTMSFSLISLLRTLFIFPAEWVVRAQVVGWTPVAPSQAQSTTSLVLIKLISSFYVCISLPQHLGDIAHLLGCFVLWQLEFPCISVSKELWASYTERVFSSLLPRRSPCGHSSHISLPHSVELPWEFCAITVTPHLILRHDLKNYK